MFYKSEAAYRREQARILKAVAMDLVGLVIDILAHMRQDSFVDVQTSRMIELRSKLERIDVS